MEEVVKTDELVEGEDEKRRFYQNGWGKNW